MGIRYKAGLPVLILALALAGGLAPSAVAEDHSSHDSDHSSEGKGKGPKYSGGRDHGSSHSDQTHEEGSHSGHTGWAGGSKALENNLFGSGKGPKYMGGQPKDEESTHHTDGEEHSH